LLIWIKVLVFAIAIAIEEPANRVIQIVKDLPHYTVFESYRDRDIMEKISMVFF